MNAQTSETKTARGAVGDVSSLSDTKDVMAPEGPRGAHADVLLLGSHDIAISPFPFDVRPRMAIPAVLLATIAITVQNALTTFRVECPKEPQAAVCGSIISIRSVTSLPVLIGALLIMKKNRLTNATMRAAPYIMAVYWSFGVVTELIAIAYESDVVGQSAKEYISNPVMLCTSVTCTFFAVCGGTMKGRIKRNVALWLGWSISFTRVGARWAYILLQAQRQNVEIDPVVLVFGIVATAIITLTVGPLFRQDLVPWPTKDIKSASFRAQGTERHAASASRAKIMALVAMTTLLLLLAWEVSSGRQISSVLTFVFALVTYGTLRMAATAHTALTRATLRLAISNMASASVHQQAQPPTRPARPLQYRPKTPRIIMSGTSSSSSSSDSDDALIIRTSNSANSARRPSRNSRNEERSGTPVPRPHVSGSGKPRNISDAIRTSRSDRRPSTSTPTRASCKEEGAGSGKSRDLQVVLDEMRNLGKGFGGGRLLGGMDAATMRGTSMGGRGQPTLCTEREAGENTGGVAMTTAGGKGGEGSRGQVARPGTGSEESERRLQSRRDRAGASDDAERIEGILRTG